MVEILLIAVLVLFVLIFLTAVAIVAIMGAAMQLDLHDMDYNYDD